MQFQRLQEEADLPYQHQRPATGGTAARGFGAVSSGDPHGRTTFWTGAFVTGSITTNTDKGYNPFSQNPTGRYLLTKKLQANLSPSSGGTVTTGSSAGYGGGY